MIKNTLACVLLLNLIWLPPIWATTVLPLSLEQLSNRAALIFHAQVISNHTRVDKQTGRIATFTEFKIIDLIKGETEPTHTIKQIGGYDPNTKTRLYIHGVPTFNTGEDYVVFLPTASSKGFCSPLGLHQGSYTVTTVDAEKIVSNGSTLTEAAASNYHHSISLPLAIDTQKPSQSRLVDFINTVRAYNTN